MNRIVGWSEMVALVASSKGNQKLWRFIAIAGLVVVNLPILLHYLGRPAAAEKCAGPESLLTIRVACA